MRGPISTVAKSSMLPFDIEIQRPKLLYVTSSNVIEAPNDHVLFDRNIKNVYFKDVKTNIVTAKDITSISFLRNIGRIYNLYDLQSDFNKNSWIDSNHWQLDLNNPSSSSSTFK